MLVISSHLSWLSRFHGLLTHFWTNKLTDWLFCESAAYLLDSEPDSQVNIFLHAVRALRSPTLCESVDCPRVSELHRQPVNATFCPSLFICWLHRGRTLIIVLIIPKTELTHLFTIRVVQHCAAISATAELLLAELIIYNQSKAVLVTCVCVLTRVAHITTAVRRDWQYCMGILTLTPDNSPRTFSIAHFLCEKLIRGIFAVKNYPPLRIIHPSEKPSGHSTKKNKFPRTSPRKNYPLPRQFAQDSSWASSLQKTRQHNCKH